MDQNEALEKFRTIAAKHARELQRNRLAEERRKRSKQEEALAEARAYALRVWHLDFIAGEFFAEFKAAYSDEFPQIHISAQHSYREPTPTRPNGYLYEQYLGVSRSGGLYVHNCVKYGKSHLITGEADLLEQVAWKILTIVADSIQNGSIWGVMLRSLE